MTDMTRRGFSRSVASATALVVGGGSVALANTLASETPWTEFVAAEYVQDFDDIGRFLRSLAPVFERTMQMHGMTEIDPTWGREEVTWLPERRCYIASSCVRMR